MRDLTLAWVAMERYDIDAVGRHLRVANVKSGQGGDGLIAAAATLVKSRRLQARGELRGALDVLDDAGSTDRPGPEWLDREILLARARLLITTARVDEALAVLGECTEPYPPDIVVLQAAALAAHGESESAQSTIQPVLRSVGLDAPVAVDAWLVMATLAAQGGNDDKARDALRHALHLAAPEAQRRAVQQVWAQLRRLLRDDDKLTKQYRALQGSTPALRRSVEQVSPSVTPLIVEPLSPREIEVLQGVAGMLPTEEIAAKLYVSVNTVKTHVRSILRKLSASRRNEAVRRARELGLI